MSNLISLGEWAKKNGIDPATARQRAGRGAFNSARKIGRNWVIDEDEKLVDHRKKDITTEIYEKVFDCKEYAKILHTRYIDATGDIRQF